MKQSQNELISIQELKSVLVKEILFAQVESGCDTTYSLYVMGNLKVFKLLEKWPDLHKDITNG